MKAFSGGLAVLATALVVSAHAGTPQESGRSQRPPPANAAGQPVRQLDGSPINYSREELLPLPPAARSRATATPGRERGPSASSAWQFSAFGSSIGLSGLLVATNAGHAEVYAGGSPTTFGPNTYWYALRYAVDGSATQVFVSDLTPSPIVRVALASQGAGAVSHIVVALADGTVQEYDQQTKHLLVSKAGDCNARGGLAAFTTADLNGDGVDEWLSVCQDQTLVASGASYGKWSLPNVGGTEIVAANLDSDPAIEIATTTGKVIDSATRSVQWTWPASFGSHLATAELGTGKPYRGLIAANAWYVVTAFDVGSQIPVWTISTPTDIGAIATADIDGDGLPDLLIGDGQFGSVKAYDIKTQSLKGQVSNPEGGVTNILVADVTGDGVPDLLWGAGGNSTGPDYLYTVSWPNKKIIWQNVDLVGPFLGPYIGDLDGDGVPEIVFASTFSNSTYASGRIIVVDSGTMAVRAISPPVMENFAWTGLHDLKLRDLQGSGRMSILIAADNLYHGQLEAWSLSRSNTFTRTWTNATRPDQAFYSVEAADLDGDGTPEVIGGAGNILYVYDSVTGAQKLQSLQMQGVEIAAIGIGDFDGDGRREIVAQGLQGYDYVFDAATLAVEAVVFGPNTALQAFQPPGALAQLMLGGADGHIGNYVFDGSGYVEASGWSTGTSAVVGIHLAPSGDWWIGSNGVLKRYRNGRPVFSTANHGNGTGRDVAFLSRKQLVLTGGSYGVFGFKVRNP